MSIICDNCGFENEDNELFCAVCNHPLQAETNAAPVQPIMAEERVNTLPQTPVKMVSPGGKYYVICEECRGKTYVNGPDIASYFCPGCQKEQFIDGIFHFIFLYSHSAGGISLRVHINGQNFLSHFS